MENFKIICTVVPNPFIANKKPNEFHFSLFLTPRLPKSVDKLGIEYNQVYEWYKYVDFFTRPDKFNLGVILDNMKKISDKNYQFDNAPKGFNISFEPEAQISCSKVPDITQAERESIYKKIFKADTPVEQWILLDKNPKPKIVELVDLKKASDEAQSPEAKSAINMASTLRSGIVVGNVTRSFATIPEVHKLVVNNSGIEDIAKHTLKPNNVHQQNAQNQEFHKKMSILASYPHLLRATGWMYDFKIVADPKDIAGKSLIKMSFPKAADMETAIKDMDDEDKELWASFFQQVEFLTPWTYFDPVKFSARYLDELNPKYFNIVDGFIQAQTAFYKLGLSQLNTRELLVKAYQAQQMGLDTTNDEADKDTRIHRLTGLGIIVQVLQHINDENGIQSPFTVGASHDPQVIAEGQLIKINGLFPGDSNINDYVLFAHNLDCGYRINVRPKGGEFNSLCKRIADYAINTSVGETDSFSYINSMRNFADEPWVAENAQIGASGVLYMDQELTRWNNWSLTCPHVGNYPNDEEPIQSPEYNDIEIKHVRALDLTPLRFGKNYDFTLRIVDICGHGRCETDAPDPACIFSTDQIYSRVDGIKQPDLFFTESIYIQSTAQTPGHNKRDRYGEDINTFVIRTQIVGNRLNPSFQHNTRAVCPAKSSYDFAEAHGVLDKYLSSIAQRMNVFQLAAYKALVPELFQKTLTPIPFLTDPCVRNFRLDLDPNVAVDVKSPYSPKMEWETSVNYVNRKFRYITLSGTNKKVVEVLWDSNKLGVQLNLPVGMIIKTASIQCLADEAFKASIGGTSMEKPVPRPVRFVHAVQKPVLLGNQDPAVYYPSYTLEATIKDRLPDAIPVTFEKLSFIKPKLFPVGTSGEFKLHASYKELVLDSEEANGYRLDDKSLLASFDNHAGELDLKIEKDNTPMEFLDKFEGFSHSFSDTKFRKIQYSIEAVSRFREYFPDIQDVSVTGDFNHVLTVKNSARPAGVNPTRIVPVFSWKSLPNNVVDRRHSKFRIYLGKEWYDTGADEMLAVLFKDGLNTIPDTYEGLISELGKDPSTQKKGGATGLTKAFFKSKDFVEHIDPRMLDRSETAFSTPYNPIDPAGLKEVSAALYTVDFDEEGKEFYCDIEVNDESMDKFYFPFLKLAICRYQSNSITMKDSYDFRFSKVTMASQMQLFPNRQVDKDNFRLNPTDSLKEQYKMKALEHYLILENNNANGLLQLVGGTDQPTTQIIRLDSQTSADYSFVLTAAEVKALINNLDPDAVYLEEFEKYEVDGNFKLDEPVQAKDFLNYNPRNDIRKRLVFTYKIR